MQRGHPTGSISRVVVVAVLTLATSGGWAGPSASSSEPRESYSEAESALIEYGLARFDRHGLELPDLTIEFFPDTRDCHSHLGLYYESELRLRMCSLDKRTMLHELAHAWANLNLSDEQKAEFSSSRNVRWNERSDAWAERGTEHAAEIIAWALADERYSIRWSSTEVGGTDHEFRLLTIGNSKVEVLHRGFVLLTGVEPLLRSSIELSSDLLELEWQRGSQQSVSPEALP